MRAPRAIPRWHPSRSVGPQRALRALTATPPRGHALDVSRRLGRVTPAGRVERRSNDSGPRAEEGAGSAAAIAEADGHEAVACIRLEVVALAGSESAWSAPGFEDT